MAPKNLSFLNNFYFAIPLIFAMLQNIILKFQKKIKKDIQNQFFVYVFLEKIYIAFFLFQILV